MRKEARRAHGAGNGRDHHRQPPHPAAPCRASQGRALRPGRDRGGDRRLHLQREPDHVLGQPDAGLHPQDLCHGDPQLHAGLLLSRQQVDHDQGCAEDGARDDRGGRGHHRRGRRIHAARLRGGVRGGGDPPRHPRDPGAAGRLRRHDLRGHAEEGSGRAGAGRGGRHRQRHLRPAPQRRACPAGGAPQGARRAHAHARHAQDHAETGLLQEHDQRDPPRAAAVHRRCHRGGNRPGDDHRRSRASASASASRTTCASSRSWRP